MGNWNITIRGLGCHHNPDLETDADRMTAEFVEKLKAAGHTVASATFSTGAEYDMSDPAQYLSRWRKPQEP